MWMRRSPIVDTGKAKIQKEELGSRAPSAGRDPTVSLVCARWLFWQEWLIYVNRR